MKKTYSAKPADISRKWYVLDASQTTLGRMSTKAASLLIGKGKPQVTAHIDCGDYVIVVNAVNLKVTGDKLNQKMYYRHSGYPGGLKERTLAAQMDENPTEVILRAVRGMLPVNKLRDGRLARLKIYSGPEHNHEAQKPVIASVKEQ
jgi:large subunit ribosomal protein L13